MNVKHIRHDYSLTFCKIRKKLNKIKKHSIACSHIRYFDLSVFTLDTQSVEVWWRYNNSDMNGRLSCMKIPKKRIKLKLKAFHKLRSHLICR